MNTAQKVRLLLVLLFCCALPASANNPPQPDGLFSILLIFPAVILGRWLAGVPPAQRKWWQKPLLTLVLTLSVILSMAGTEIALIPLLIILWYGIRRGVQIITRGQGGKRIIIGAAVIVCVLLGITDYLASLAYVPSTPVMESSAILRLRSLASAESEFRTPSYTKRLPSTAYGTMAELSSAQLLDSQLAAGTVRGGYLYGEIIDKDKNQFLFYAVPAFPPTPESKWRHVIPGGSLFWAAFGEKDPQATGVRSFAVDESGVIRTTGHRAIQSLVTREEALRWQVLQ